jgi:hypothetical protein
MTYFKNRVGARREASEAARRDRKEDSVETGRRQGERGRGKEVGRGKSKRITISRV